MIRIGKIQSVDSRSNSGILVDTRGVEFFFSGYDCKDEVIPPKGSIVTFIEDNSYRNTAAACYVCEYKLDGRAA